MVITNIISAEEGENAKFIQYEYATYKAVFDDVKIFKVSDINSTETQNLIIVGIKGNSNIDENKYEKYKKLLDMEITKKITPKNQVVTDDFAPIGN